METNSRNKYLFKRGKTDGIGFALLLIFFGTAFLFLNLDIIPAAYKPVLISWQMLLILVGLWWVVIRRKFLGGIVLIGLGFFFLYPVLCSAFPGCFADMNINLKKYWPVFLIVFGMLLVADKLSPSKRRCGDKQKKDSDASCATAKTGRSAHNDTDFFEKNMVFGSTEQIVLSHNFKGGEANVVFGELIIDLRKTVLADDADHLELNTVFGNLIVYLPADWAVETDSTIILGALKDKRLHKDEPVQNEKTTRFRIKANSIFGNIEIRN